MEKISLKISLILIVLHLPSFVSDHYRGGTITWKPADPTSLVNPVEIIITLRQSWTLSRYQCNATNMNVFGAYNDTNNITRSTLDCISSSAACSTAGYQNIDLPFICIDFSPSNDISTGTYITRQNLTLNSVIHVAWRGASWLTDIMTNGWSMISRIDLNPVPGGLINSPPVTISLPVVQLQANQLEVIQILAADWNTDHFVRCRWSHQLPDDECGNACFNLPNASLSSQDCAITWRAILRSEDILAGRNSSTYVIAITAEDFTNASSTKPLSATPHQIIVRVMMPQSDQCLTKPSLMWAPRRNQACFAMTVGSTWTFIIGARVYCLNSTIVEFITTKPLGMNVSDIIQTSNYTWQVTYIWKPTADQIGIQPFCVAAIDNFGVSTSIFCYAIAVDGSNPSVTPLVLVQGSASPVGTIMATQTRFSILANLPLRRTVKNSTLITIRELPLNIIVHVIDCKYSPDVFFINNIIIFYVRNPPWILGKSYSIAFDEGVATANNTCGTETAGFSGLTWVITIWNPSMSSTTTPPTTTTTATLGTVATRTISTTTPNTMLTTTGITPFTTVTTTSSTSTTSVTTTTTTTATTTTTTTTTITEYIPTAAVIYPKDMERLCLPAVTIATAIVTVAMIPLHGFAMSQVFSTVLTQFRKEILVKKVDRRRRRCVPILTESAPEAVRLV